MSVALTMKPPRVRTLEALSMLLELLRELLLDLGLRALRMFESIACQSLRWLVLVGVCVRIGVSWCSASAPVTADCSSTCAAFMRVS